MNVMFRQVRIALRLLLVMVLALGLAYPAALWMVGRLDAGSADGSFVTDGQGVVIGSSLIGQSFAGPDWFHGRPSVAGSGYDATQSGASNLAQSSPQLLEIVATRKAELAREESTSSDSLPVDALTASASGLDPDISPAYALLQVQRIAKSRSIAPSRLTTLVDNLTQGRTVGVFGEPHVNVLELNEALQQLQ